MKCCLVACLAACAAVVVVAGCRPAGSEHSDEAVNVELEFDPSPPVVGEADVTLTLASPDGQPLADANVRLEGNMNHAGMKPSFADLEEVEPGRYTGTLDFTMGGDWFVLVNANTADGGRVERKIDVPGVMQP